MVRDYALVDLFCGAGGLSLGLQRAGFRIVAAYDHWRPAIKTYRTNFQDHIQHAEITEDLDLPKADVIVGGPPCQGFSSAGMRRHDDHRNTLVAIFARLVAEHRPRAFVFENVEGFLTGGRGQFVFDLVCPLVQAGYRIHLRKVNAANYGVPQHRKRVIAIGGLGWSPSFPEPTHSAYGAPGAHLAGRHLEKTPSLEETLAGMPKAVELKKDSKDCCDHSYSPLKEDDLTRARLLKPGQRMRDLPEDLWHESYRRRAHRRVMDGTPVERRGGAPAGLRRLCPDEPSKAITGGALAEFLHPYEDRPLTLRECAKLQTFPEEFIFPTSRAHTIQLIGNAVPPRLAEIVGQCLIADLQSQCKTTNKGSLLTFVPTLSNGMSPILKEVTEKVGDEFNPADAAGQTRMQWA